MDQNSLIVDGFVFPSYKEAQVAVKEKMNIDIIKERTPLQDSKVCFDLYSKLIEREMFKTMVGFSFLNELRHHLLVDFGYKEQDLPLVKLPKRMEYDKVNEMNQGVLKSKLERATQSAKRLKFLVFVLTFMVVAMFVIAVINPNTGYINTEAKVLDKYSAWQEELEQREQVVKEREAELKINHAE